MNDFYNCEYLSERVAALAKERDELKKIAEKQMRMNRSMAVMTLEMDNLRGELARAEERLHEWEKFRRELLSAGKTPPEKWEGKRC